MQINIKMFRDANVDDTNDRLMIYFNHFHVTICQSANEVVDNRSFVTWQRLSRSIFESKVPHRHLIGLSQSNGSLTWIHDNSNSSRQLRVGMEFQEFFRETPTEIPSNGLATIADDLHNISDFNFKLQYLQLDST